MVTMDAKTKVKTEVYSKRIRINEFFCDYDKLRCGTITPSQFKSGLSSARINLSAGELDALCEEYKVFRSDGEPRVSYATFCQDIDKVFTKPNLEKAPLEEVELVPAEIEQYLSPDRFTRMPLVDLGEEKEAKLASVLATMRDMCRVKSILVKPFFDDSCKNQNSAMLVNHVTTIQFKQALKNHIAPEMKVEDVELLVEKFEDKGMINYVAFAAQVEPPFPKYDSYSLQ